MPFAVQLLSLLDLEFECRQFVGNSVVVPVDIVSFLGRRVDVGLSTGVGVTIFLFLRSNQKFG